MAFLVFYVVVSVHPDWDGMSSFGARFFVSLTPLFILGLAAFFNWLAGAWRERRAAIASTAVTALSDCLEFRPDISMGRPFNSRTRPDFLA